MFRHLVNCGIFSVVIFLASCTFLEGNKEVYQVEEVEPIVYRTVDGQDLSISMMRPVGAGNPLPVILIIPNSFFQASKTVYKNEQLRLGSRGYITASVDYRDDLFPPVGISDIKTAVRWIRIHAEDYNIDPDKMVIMGNGSGINRAMLAVMSGTDPHYDEGSDFAGVSADVDAIIVINGEIKYENDLNVHHRFGGTPEEYPERYDTLNVLNLLSPDNPPILWLTNRRIDRRLDEAAFMEKSVRFFGNSSLLVIRERAFGVNDIMSFEKGFNPIDQFLDYYLLEH